jgi:hypothetical protein
VRRAGGVGPSVERDFWRPRAIALVRNPASLSDEQERCARCRAADFEAFRRFFGLFSENWVRKSGGVMRASGQHFCAKFVSQIKCL